jgi:hypothetical protein
MSLVRLIGIAAAFVAVVLGPAQAASYYVDAANGADERSGLSPGEAWRSLARVNAARLMPGDSVQLRRGQTWRGKITLKASGRSDAPITIASYGEGADAVLTGDANGIVGIRQRHIVVRNLRIENMSGAGILIHGAGDWLIERVSIARTGRVYARSDNNEHAGAIQWWNGDRLTIADSTMTEITGSPIWVWNIDGLKILRNTILVAQGHSSDNIHLYKPRNFEIRGNQLSMEGETDSGKGNILIYGGENGVVAENSLVGGSFGLSTTASDLKVIDNVFANHTKFRWSSGVLVGEVFNVANNLFARNTFRNANTGIYLFNLTNERFVRQDIVIRDNRFEGMHRAAVLIEAPVSGAFTDNEIRAGWRTKPVEFAGSVIRGQRWIDAPNTLVRTPPSN